MLPFVAEATNPRFNSPAQPANTGIYLAREITQGKNIDFRQRWNAEQKLSNICRILRCDDSLTVYSDDREEYYGSIWEI